MVTHLLIEQQIKIVRIIHWWVHINRLCKVQVYYGMHIGGCNLLWTHVSELRMYQLRCKEVGAFPTMYLSHKL